MYISCFFAYFLACFCGKNEKNYNRAVYVVVVFLLVLRANGLDKHKKIPYNVRVYNIRSALCNLQRR